VSEQTSGGGGDAKFQALSRNLLAALYMLVRSARLYDPENAIFQKPLNLLLETVNTLIAKEGRLELTIANGAFYLNDQLVRVDATSAENLKVLATEMEAQKVGGFSLQRSTTIAELRNFLAVFAREQAKDEVAEDGLEGRKLAAMKLRRWSKLKEKLDSAKLDANDKVDRKKYALTLYARGVFFMNEYMEKLRTGKPFPPSRALRLVQDLVDISMEYRNQFLGMSSNGTGEAALSYHLVNTALIAIAFGGELGLTKQQLKELGVAALLNEAGLAQLPIDQRLRLQPEKLPAEAQRKRAAILREAAGKSLAEPGSRRLQIFRALSCVQMHEPFGTPIRTSDGKISMITPVGDPLLFSRILAICSYYDVLTTTTADHEAFGPEVGLALMWNQERYRFDPELLAAFVRIMAKQPLKMLRKDQGKLIDIAGV